MQARMKNPALLIPEALTALLALGKAAENCGLPARTIELVHLRTSQINGCSVCVDMGFRQLQEAGETPQRTYGITAWREMPYFTDAERAALALTDVLTRLSEQREGVPDAVWNEAARHYDERALAALVLSIALNNVWNRLNSAVRQVAGTPWH